MFGSKLALKILLRENARLRRENQRKDQILSELLDRFVHNRVPERLVSDRPSNLGLSNFTPTQASDAYSQAIEDAERLADQHPGYQLEQLEDDD